MTFRRRLLLCAALLGFASPARAAVFYPTTFTLDNGLQIIVVPNHLAPAVTQMVWYKVGSADETAGQTGLAHYLEHLMFRGSKDVPPGQFSKRIAAQGGNDNAFTSYDYTAFHETMAADRLPMIMKMEADRMQNLQITQETATPELQVVLNERQERTDNNPEGKFEEKLRHTLLPGYPYGTPVIGWKPEIQKLNAAEAMQFYHAHYAPNNAVVIISGDVTPEQVKQLADEIYGPLPKGKDMSRGIFPAIPDPSQHRFEMVDPGVEQPILQWEVVAPSYSTESGNKAYALEVLADALDDGEVGLLYRDLVAKKGIASAIETNYDPDARGVATFTVEATPAPGKNPRDLEKALHDEIAALAQSGIDEKTITDAETRLTREAIFVRDSLLSPGYAFGSALTTGHTVDDVEVWPDRINAVTASDVNAVLHDLANDKHNVTGLLLPDPHATPEAREAAHPAISHDMSIR